MKFNIPTKITLIRVGLIPLFVIILSSDIPKKEILAAFIFIMLSISDFLDGYFARKKKQVTDFGKLIDPIADKLLISTALIFLIGKGVELWMAAAIISREIIITAVRIYLLPHKLVIPASNFGKAKTITQSIAIVFVLLQLPFGWHLMVIAVMFTLASGVEYLIKVRKLTENKIINLPNLITLARLLLIAPFVYYSLNSRKTFSLIIFAFISLGDKLDGLSARLMKQTTDFGSVFDSLTDWLFLFSNVLLFIYNRYVSVEFGSLMIALMFFIAIVKIYHLKKHKKVVTSAVSRLAVASGYLTILAFLIDFAYKEMLMVACVLLIILSAIIFFGKLTASHPTR